MYGNQNHINLLVLVLFLMIPIALCAKEPRQDTAKPVSFYFGGFVKADFIRTWYHDGMIERNLLLNDFHIPSQIPLVGEPSQTLHFHAKESRFDFDIVSRLGNQKLEGFIEVDFLLSEQGNEVVSNSFSPRLRHFYIRWDGLLVGQTWSTFMITTLPLDLDLNGAMDGTVINRQVMLRYEVDNWWFAIENPTTYFTGTDDPDSSNYISESDLWPDVVIRKNFNTNRVELSVAGIARFLRATNSRYDQPAQAFGYGISAGGKIGIGKRGDEIRTVFTAGNGLGRYLAAAFIPDGFIQNNALHTRPTLSGFFSINHYWLKDLLSSNFNAAAFYSLGDKSMLNGWMNEHCYSVSGNLKYEPVQGLLFGIEVMYAYRQTADGTNGAMTRIQFSTKYRFGYTNKAAIEK